MQEWYIRYIYTEDKQVSLSYIHTYGATGRTTSSNMIGVDVLTMQLGFTSNLTLLDTRPLRIIRRMNELTQRGVTCEER